MQALFTPWRYDYLTAPKEPAQRCIFCDAARGEDLEGTLTLYRDDAVVIMLNRYPYSNGHLMVAPAEHAARLFESSTAVLTNVMRAAAQAQRILSDVYHPEGFNVGMNFGKVAGAGFADHYHMHIVPRWGGDTNFMTVTAQTRLVPEDLNSTYNRLAPYFSKLSAGERDPE